MEIDNKFIEELKNSNRTSVEFNEKCTQLATSIIKEQLSVVSLVEQLGVLLVDISPQNREHGTWILTEILKQIPSDHLNQKQLHFICAFYTDRLKDHHQVVPAVLSGISTLLNFKNYPNEAAPKALTALFQNTSCQQQQEQDRYMIYKIFSQLLNKCSREMGLDFVYGVIAAVDGERSPKNLLFLFGWLPQFFKTVTLAHLTEEAFEVVACYFPVDFKAPANDSMGVTRDELAELLAHCLTAIPQFAEFCLPLALEKLESSLEVAKLDALTLLQLGCLTFDKESYLQHSREIWSQIQRDIFSDSSPLIETKSLQTLTAIINKISDDNSFKTIIKDILDTLKGNLLPDSKLFNASNKLLLSIAEASKISCDLIVKEIVPILVNSFNITTTPEHKIKFLKTSVDFFSAYAIFHETVEMEELRTIPFLCLKASLENNDLRREGFNGLSKVTRFLSSDLRSTLLSNLKCVLLVNEEEEVLNCFKAVAETFPNEVQESLIKNIQITSDVDLQYYLNALAKIVPYNFFTETVVEIYISYLNSNVDFSKVAIKTFKILLQEYEKNNLVMATLFRKNLPQVIVSWFINNEVNLDLFTLKDASLVLKTLIRNEQLDRQQTILNTELPNLSPLNSHRIFIWDGIMCCLLQEVQINYDVFNILTKFILNEPNIQIKEVGAQLLANLINKCRKEEELLNYLAQFKDNNDDFMVMAWITKGLVMRNHSIGNIWVDKMLDALSRDGKVAQAFGIVVNDFPSLSSQSYCNCSLFYQQKFFTVVTNTFNEKYEQNPSAYLTAFGYLLEGIPKAVVKLQFSKILKLLILTLEFTDVKVLVTILNILKDLVDDKEKCIEDHLSEFLNRFLKLCCCEKSMKVRILALQCIKGCTSFPIYKLLIHKQEVLRILGQTVDDKKRIVRREAVEARSAWFLIDAPE